MSKKTVLFITTHHRQNSSDFKMILLHHVMKWDALWRHIIERLKLFKCQRGHEIGFDKRSFVIQLEWLQPMYDYKTEL